jgi:hypothetical protein
MINIKNKNIIDTYKLNKSIKVGKIIVCPICGKEIIKTHYAQAFCSNECKNAYWNKKGDRHKKGYYHKYNKEHPERLNRGFTKGYVNGNVSEGAKTKKNNNIWYDALGRPHSNDFFNPTFSDLLDWKCFGEWHDDDWCEGAWGE